MSCLFQRGTPLTAVTPPPTRQGPEGQPSGSTAESTPRIQPLPPPGGPVCWAAATLSSSPISCPYILCPQVTLGGCGNGNPAQVSPRSPTPSAVPPDPPAPSRPSSPCSSHTEFLAMPLARLRALECSFQNVSSVGVGEGEDGKGALPFPPHPQVKTLTPSLLSAI